jgi:prophage regulatory protein
MIAETEGGRARATFPRGKVEGNATKSGRSTARKAECAGFRTPLGIIGFFSAGEGAKCSKFSPLFYFGGECRLLLQRQTRARDFMRLINREGLKLKGIDYSASHLWRLINAGKFPRPVKIGSRNAWPEEEIDQLIKDRIAARDSEKAVA